MDKKNTKKLKTKLKKYLTKQDQKKDLEMIIKYINNGKRHK